MQKGLKMFNKINVSAFVNITMMSLFLIAIVSTNATAFDRKVLFEDFTSTTCPPCASSAAAIEAGLEQAGDDLVVSTAYHVWWPGAGNDPWYLDNNSDNRIRVQYYGVNGVPTFKIDGNTYNGQRSGDALEAALRQAARRDAPVEISLRCTIEDNVLTVVAEVTAEEDLNNVRFYISLNESYYFFRAPTGQNDHYDAMIKMLPDGNGTAFSIDDQETLGFEEEINLNDVGWHDLERDNLIVTAWVQGNDRAVHQSQNFFFAPGIMMDEWDLVDDAGGDGDGRAEPGETAGIVVTLENSPTRMTVEDLTLQIFCNDDQITFENDIIEIDVLESGEVYTNEDEPFEFVVDDDFIAHPVTFSLLLTSEDGAIEMELEFELMIDWPVFLIVDASNDEDAGIAIQEFFGRDLPYADYFNKAESGFIHPATIGNYDIVIWHSFNQESDIVNDFEDDILRSYLDGGGKLVMSSPGYIVEHANGRLMRSYFHAEMTDDDTQENRFNGIADAEHFDGGDFYAGGTRGTGAGYPDFMPGIAALDGATEVLEWASGDVCGVSFINDTYSTLLLSFPIESIEGFFGTDSREEFIERVLDWAGGGLSVPNNPDELAPYQFSMQAAYPNPFNSKTMIPFTVNASGNITLSLFDIAGREIAELLNSDLNAGNHTISLDAEALGISSGVYYLRLSSGVNNAKQKILYLR